MVKTGTTTQRVVIGVILGSATLASYYVYAKRSHFAPSGTSVKMQSTNSALPSNPWNNK